MKNILLVFGGKSYEHDISVVTASQIFNKTRIKDVNLVLFYISRDNKYFVYESKKFILSDFSKKKFSPSNKKFKEVCFVSGEDNILFAKSIFGLKEYLRAEYAIFACHGGDGENGKLVSILENSNIFSSAGSFDSLAVCMNKYLFKQVMRGLHIPVAKGFKISWADYEKNADTIFKQVKKLKFPVIIKSNNGGSSIGLFVAETEDEFKEKLASAFEFDTEVLVEAMVHDAREFNIAVLGDADEFQISEIDEPIKDDEILSFADKYLSSNKGPAKGGKLGGAKTNSMASQARKFPAELDTLVAKKIRTYAEKIFKNLSLSGVVRIDFLLEKETNKLYVCEVNAIPGSLAYYFFSRDSILVNDLSLRLISIAENAKKRKYDINQEFSTEILG